MLTGLLFVFANVTSGSFETPGFLLDRLWSNKAVPPFCEELFRAVRFLFFRIEAQPSPNEVLIESFAS